MLIKNSEINKGIEYILNHIDEKISIEDVASHCNFSKYHFSRMFKEETGVSIYQFIKQIKIDQSAVTLKIEPNKTITEVGEKFGYSSSNYSSAFSKQYYISPIEFRKNTKSRSVSNPFYTNECIYFKSFEYYNENITIQQLPEFNVLYEKHIGNYVDIETNWYKFMDKYKEYFSENTLLIEKSYNDPSISKINECIYDLCITVSKDKAGKNIEKINSSTYAVYRFEGFINDIFGEFQGVFNVWLPKSSYKRSDGYALGIYRNIDKENNRVTMDLCIPIK